MQTGIFNKTNKLEFTSISINRIFNKSLQDKDLTIFFDVDNQANVKTAELEMPASHVLIFGNPLAGTNLMLKDITMSLDLPLRLAVIDMDGQTKTHTPDYRRLLYKLTGRKPPCSR